MWWYKYLRADREEIDMGPYKNREEAQKASDEHKSFGALTSGAFEKPDDYKPYQGSDE